MTCHLGRYLYVEAVMPVLVPVTLGPRWIGGLFGIGRSRRVPWHQLPNLRSWHLPHSHTVEQLRHHSSCSLSSLPEILDLFDPRLNYRFHRPGVAHAQPDLPIRIRAFQFRSNGRLVDAGDGILWPGRGDITIPSAAPSMSVSPETATSSTTETLQINR